MIRVTFPGDGRDWPLLVADTSAPIWRAVAQIMATEPYLFREVAGGTYNCRPPSLHAYGLALDLNPSKNPFQNPPVHNYPATFITRMEGIRANGKQAIYWGGRFPADNPPDTMHWQINVAPSDVVNVTWDKGDDDETEYEMTPAQFASRLSQEQVDALVDQKGEGGVWVISPTSADRESIKTYYKSILNQPGNVDWVGFYEEVQTEALVNAAIRKAGSSSAAVPLKVTLTGTAKP